MKTVSLLPIHEPSSLGLFIASEGPLYRDDVCIKALFAGRIFDILKVAEKGQLRQDCPLFFGRLLQKKTKTRSANDIRLCTLSAAISPILLAHDTGYCVRKAPAMLRKEDSER